MSALQIGPLIIDWDRVPALVGIAAYLLLTAILLRRVAKGKARRSAERFVTAGLIVWVVAARAGYVADNFEIFADAPASILALWQGGFDPTLGAMAFWALCAIALFARLPAGKPMLIAGLAVFAATEATTLLAPDPSRGRLSERSYESLAGDPVQLAAQDRPLVVNLWATWCPPCRRELPMMMEAAQTQEEVGIYFANQGERRERIARYLGLAELGQANVVLDPESRIMASFAAQGLPTTLFFDAAGRLSSVHVGEISRAELHRQIDILTGETE